MLCGDGLKVSGGGGGGLCLALKELLLYGSNNHVCSLVSLLLSLVHVHFLLLN